LSNTIVEIREYLVAHSYQMGDAEQLGSSEDLLEDGILDSFGIMDLVSFLRERYALEFEAEEMVPETFRTLEAIATFVDGKLAARG
jgi:acyl carrier protein